MRVDSEAERSHRVRRAVSIKKYLGEKPSLYTRAISNIPTLEILRLNTGPIGGQLLKRRVDVLAKFYLITVKAHNASKSRCYFCQLRFILIRTYSVKCVYQRLRQRFVRALTKQFTRLHDMSKLGRTHQCVNSTSTLLHPHFTDMTVTDLIHLAAFKFPLTKPVHITYQPR